MVSATRIVFGPTRIGAVMTAILLLMTACATIPVEEEEEETESVGIPLEFADDVTIDPEACSGTISQPRSEHTYLVERAYVPLTADNPYGEARVRARQALARRFCIGQQERCEEAEGLVQIWEMGQDGRQVCAMALVRESFVQEFLAHPREILMRDLSGIAANIAAHIRRSGDEGPQAIVLDTINDQGVNGGPRAEWLHDQMLTALAHHRVDTRQPPREWSGLRTPTDTMGILRARVREAPGEDGRLAVSWRLEWGTDHQVTGMGSAEFPEIISAGDVDPRTFLPELPQGNGSVSLHLDTRPGGALCDGQETSLWLEASEELHVRILNLFGGDRGTVVFSTGDEPLPANQLIALGDFNVERYGSVAVERFIVIAAPTKEDLGRFADVEPMCRMPNTLSQALMHGRQLPEDALQWTSSLDYRILTGDDCEGVRPSRGAFMDHVFPRLPTCW